MNNTVKKSTKDNFQYIGLFLTKETKESLINIFFKDFYKQSLENKDINIYLHHCTLIHKSQIEYMVDEDLVDKYLKILGKEYKIVITHIGESDKALAFKVDLMQSGIMSLNDNPHITIATYNGGKPVDSNQIVDWKPLAPFTISTFLDVR